MENTSGDTPSVGGGGELFARQDNWRSDSRMAARMLSLGVISEDRAKMLLVAGFELAEKAAVKENARAYKAAMSVPLTALRIEQMELARLTPQQHEHSGTITLDERRKQVTGILAILRDRAGAIEAERIAGPNGNGHSSNGNGKSNGHA